MDNNARRQAKEIFVDIVVAVFFILFAWIHLAHYIVDRYLVLLLVVIAETLLFVFYIMRNRAASVSGEPWDWFCAIGGTFAGLFFRPDNSITTLTSIGDSFLIVGIFVQIASVLSLNKRIGIIPAHRGIQTRGMYRFVRHPMYAAYILVDIGYIISFPTVWNISIALFAMAFQFLRIHNEERHLGADRQYKTYAAKVRWRIAPYIY